MTTRAPPVGAGSSKVQDVTLTGSSTLTFTDRDITGDANVNHHYAVIGANSCGAAAAPGARSGEMKYELVR